MKSLNATASQHGEPQVAWQFLTQFFEQPVCGTSLRGFSWTACIQQQQQLMGHENKHSSPGLGAAFKRGHTCHYGR
jgi:hypothetical protein